ncbi:MAG TPA: tetratricopeptide repeat protein [Terriglobales bacterium]|jgi:cytochrome c-type biogenesis protein CcmH/NrfG|nr:tetratricopeptide repeat protein [Terriglobales bacterium]
MAAGCLLAGLLIGYLFRGSESPKLVGDAGPASTLQGSGPAAAHEGPQAMPTLEQMKHMADKQAEPLLAQLKTDPGNAELLVHIAYIYKSTHQFQEATSYLDKALQLDPKNVRARSELASCLYYTGDVDGAIRQLEQAVKDDPKNANSLFNLGVIRWQGKKDGSGAIAAWQQLLKSNPGLEASKKDQVEKLIAEVRNSKPN